MLLTVVGHILHTPKCTKVAVGAVVAQRKRRHSKS